MTTEQILLAIFVFAPLLLGACCLGLASRVDDARAAPDSAKRR